MSFKSTELCLLLVEENYGELAARIFKVLMVSGRQHLPEIISCTRLKPSEVRRGLTTLIQQRMVIWSTGAPTFYQADWLAAYSLIRSGKFAEATRRRYGSQVGTVLSHCLLEGDIRAAELEHIDMLIGPENGNSSKVNGDSSGSRDGQGGSCDAIYKLLEDGMAIVTNASHFRTPEENRRLVEQCVRHDHPNWADKIKIIDRAAFQEKIVNGLVEWKYGSDNLKANIKSRRLLRLGTNLTRHFSTIEGPDSNEQVSDKTPDLLLAKRVAPSSFDNDIVVRANYDKYPVLVRSRKLVQLAAESIGGPTSRVYETILGLCDKNITHCKEFQRDPETAMYEDHSKHSIVTMGDIFQDIGDIEYLKEAIGQPYRVVDSSALNHQGLHRDKRQRRESDEGNEVNGTKPTQNGRNSNSDSDSSIVVRTTRSNGRVKHKNSKETIPNGSHKGKGKAKASIAYDSDAHMDSSSEDEGLSAAGRHVVVNSHLKILTEHHLLTYHAPGTSHLNTEGWSVPFNSISHRLRITEINTTICSHYGTDALRIARVLQKRGKLDEKSLASFVMMESKLMRSRLLALQTAGYIELQELPRDNNRAPSKTLYLWFFDEDRCARQMMQDHYQAMSRCLQRLRVERERIGDVLAKCQRSDVHGREEEVLPAEEWKRLEKWRATEQQLLGEVGRLDDGVVLLRDL